MSNKKKALFYAPHAGVAYFSGPEAALAHELQNMGYEVHYTSCRRTLRPYCATMSAHSLHQDSPESEKDRVCKKCEKSADFLIHRYGFKNHVALKDFFTDEDAKEVQNLVAKVTQENYLDFHHLGVPVGRKALYEFLLQYKKSDLEFNEVEWRHYKMAVKVALKSLISGARIVDQVQPDLIVCYNTQYSVNAVMEAYGKTKNIPTYFIHGGLNISRGISDLMMAIAPPPQYYKRVAKAWPKFSGVPLKPYQVQDVLGHMRELFDASNVFVYSSPTKGERPNLRALYGIRRNQKILVATMSSYDERFAAESNLTLDPVKDSIFKSQIEWIQFMVDYVKVRPDLFLLIRVHPREFPNKRERVKSQHAERLNYILHKLPTNVKVNWPTDSISLYHIAEEASVFLNAWSSTGKEMGALGRPVVLYNKDLPFYATDINFTAKTRDEYVSMIEQSLNTPFDFQRVIAAFRLFYLEFHRATIDLSDTFTKADLFPRLQFLRKVEGKLLKYTSSIHQLRRLCRKPVRIHDKEALDQFLMSPPKDLIEFRGIGESAGPEEERTALLVAFQEMFKTLYPQDIEPSNPSASLYSHMRKFLEDSPQP